MNTLRIRDGDMTRGGVVSFEYAGKDGVVVTMGGVTFEITDTDARVLAAWLDASVPHDSEGT